jgi:acyl-CoA synthetase (NDP forming)
MVPPGIETIVGLVDDPSFGPLVMFGLGGTATEVLGDRALSLVPLNLAEATDLINSLRASRLLTGYRGSPAVDIAVLADLLCRVALLAAEVSEVVEMDLNPVIAGPHGCLALDAKIHVEHQAAPEPALRRRHLSA